MRPAGAGGPGGGPPAPGATPAAGPEAPGPRAYVIAELEVTDPAGFEAYRREVLATVERHGGRFLVRGGRSETLEEDWRPPRLVILEFPSWERAERWYRSEDYRELLALRRRTARTRVVLVEGI